MNELRYQLRYALPVWFIMMGTAPLPENRVTQRIRGRLLEAILDAGGGLRVAGRVLLVNVAGLHLGRDVYIGPGSWINALGGVTLEDEVTLAPYVCISSTQHGFRDGSVFGGGTHLAPVRVGRGTWLAAHTVVAAGVTIGPGNLVAANAAVTTDTGPNVKVAGVPGRAMGHRSDNPSDITTRHG